jgi:SAM-dependent methyltransferase
MGRGTRGLSREIGLEIGSILGRYFFGLEHLHYGLWPDGRKASLSGLAEAQERYTQLLISQIPDGLKTILDVGCGGGGTARALIDLGYRVDCLSPSPYLVRQTREKIGESGRVFECKYEEFEAPDRYDLIIFSESFQYVNMEKSLSRSIECLHDNGHILICDIFKKKPGSDIGLGGGHPLDRFHEWVGRYPLELVRELDITDQTAPNIDLLNEVMQEVVLPIITAGGRLFDDRHPLLLKMLKLGYRKKLDRNYNKYFRSDRTGESFRKNKAYKVFLYRKT